MDRWANKCKAICPLQRTEGHVIDFVNAIHIRGREVTYPWIYTATCHILDSSILYVYTSYTRTLTVSYTESTQLMCYCKLCITVKLYNLIKSCFTVNVSIPIKLSFTINVSISIKSSFTINASIPIKSSFTTNVSIPIKSYFTINVCIPIKSSFNKMSVFQ